MQFDRRTFVKGAGAAATAAALPGTAAARPPRAKIADGLALDGGPQEVLVVFDSNGDVDKLDRFDLPRGHHAFSALPIGYAAATGEQIEAIARLQSVRRVEQNRELEFLNDDAREETGAAAIQSGGRTGEGAHVAVIDSGISALHPDHQANLRHNYKYVNPLDRETAWVDVGNRADTDDNGHGTHCAGSVAGDGSRSEGQYKGMAPDADLTVYSTGVTLAVVNTVAAFDHLLEDHPDRVDVVSNSYGPTSGNGRDFDPDSAINVAAWHAFERGTLPLFAAGNSGPGTNTLSNYAKAPYVLGVAATDDAKRVTDFSSRGRTPAYDGETNYDRDRAMANFRDLLAAREADPARREPTGQTVSGSGTTAGAVVVGAVQTTDPFTVAAFDGPFAPDRYEIDATLSWTPESPDAEPSDADLTLLDADGNAVATTGNGGTDVHDEARETLTAIVEAGRTYQFEVTGWRGPVRWELSAEVKAVDAADDAPSPAAPYGIYRPGVGAPGNRVVSTMSPNDPLQGTDAGTETSQLPYYAAISGTSMATPVTAGIAALIYAAFEEAHGRRPAPMTVIEALESTALFLPDAKNHTAYNVGRGFVDAPAALAAALATVDDESAPTVESFAVEDTRPRNANADLRADWSVADADGDLETVRVALVDADTGSTLETATTDVGGGAASGTDEFRRTGANGETYEVRLTVTDGAGERATATRTVAVSAGPDPSSAAGRPTGPASHD